MGANNIWNELEVEGDDDLDGSKLHRRLLHSKLYRLATVFRHVQSDSYGGEAKHDPQKPARKRAYLDWRREGKRSSAERRERRLFADMGRMVETVAAFSTPILFLTYPQDPEAPVSKLIGRFAGDLGVRAIVTSRDRRRALSDGLRMPQLFVSAAGPHPSPALYRYIVDSLQGPVVELVGLAPPESR